jgi:hypothetical protein
VRRHLDSAFVVSVEVSVELGAVLLEVYLRVVRKHVSAGAVLVWCVRNICGLTYTLEEGDEVIEGASGSSASTWDMISLRPCTGSVLKDKQCAMLSVVCGLNVSRRLQNPLWNHTSCCCCCVQK